MGDPHGKGREWGPHFLLMRLGRTLPPSEAHFFHFAKLREDEGQNLEANKHPVGIAMVMVGGHPRQATF